MSGCLAFDGCVDGQDDLRHRIVAGAGHQVGDGEVFRADASCGMPTEPRKPLGAIHPDGGTRARDYLCETAPGNVTSDALEWVSGLDRYSLSRHFRALFGTSPHRFLTMRRLDMARQRIEDAMPLAEEAFAAGFSDQAHMTRHFKKAFGVTPGV